jgi:hypothetical protein
VIRRSGDSREETAAMPAARHHFHCEACEGTWVAELEIEAVVTGDCPFCRARDVFAYRSDDGVAAKPDAGRIAQRLAARLRKAARKTASNKTAAHKPDAARIKRAS